MASSLRTQEEDDIAPPPAKRLRAEALPVQDSPKIADTPDDDDMADLYDTTEVISGARPLGEPARGSASTSAQANTASLWGSSGIPGLGLLSSATQQPMTAQASAEPDVQDDRLYDGLYEAPRATQNQDLESAHPEDASDEKLEHAPAPAIRQQLREQNNENEFEISPEGEMVNEGSLPTTAADSNAEPADSKRVDVGAQVARDISMPESNVLDRLQSRIEEGLDDSISDTSVEPEQIGQATADPEPDMEQKPELQEVESIKADTKAQTMEAESLPDQTTSKPKPQHDEEFMHAAEANKGDKDAEWQFDSSDAESSDDSDDSSDSSSDEEESEDEGLLLTAEEQAKMLMAEADQEDGAEKTTKNPPRTQNEVEERIEKPSFTVTPDMKIVELGTVDSVVENSILIKGRNSGEYQVLDTGSVLCLADRSVIGAVLDTFGRVQEPLYSVGFSTAAEIAEAGITKGTTIYYVEQHSTYVFTQPLRNLKGTDASNLYDEEAGIEEVEFSDDEAEAEYKRNRKMAKAAAKGSTEQSRPQHQNKQPNSSSKPAVQGYPTNGINYDDDDDTDMYTPLARPADLHHLMGSREPPEERRDAHGRPEHRWSGRDRRDRGGRGGHGRGGRDNRNGRDNRGQRNDSVRHLNSRSPDNQRRNGGDQRRAANRPRQGQHQHRGQASRASPSVNRNHGAPPPSQQTYSPAVAPAFPTAPPPATRFPQFPFMPPPPSNHQAFTTNQQQPFPWPPTGFPSYTYNGAVPQAPFIPPQPSLSPANQPATGAAPLPAGAHINPSFFAQQQAQGQQMAAYGAQPVQQSNGFQNPAAQASVMELLQRLARGGAGV